MENKAVLAIAVGERRFEGTGFGAMSPARGITAVFSGSVGLQEFITDPASAGLIPVMTNPIAGISGINLEDMESDEIWISALVVREKCENPGGWRCELELDAFLRRRGVPGLEAVDTRALARHIRKNGASPAVITNSGIREEKSVVREYKAKRYTLPGKGPRIAIIDLGTRKSVIARLTEPDIDGNLFIFSADTEYEEIIAVAPAFVLLTNGPGERFFATENTKNTKIKDVIQKLANNTTVYGIGTGAVLLGIALGAEAEALRVGHHGSSVTIKSTDSKLYVTEQNHGYTIKNLPSLLKTEFVNVNDGSVEGFSGENAYGVMFQPETAMTHSRSTAFFYEMLKRHKR